MSATNKNGVATCGYIFNINNSVGVQVANPPYSAHISNQSKMADDPRFNEYGKLAPASKADFAFVQHMVHHMDEDGRIAVLLPHGVLFRSGAEETIREYMIKKLNVIDAIIGLPSNLFFGTGIPVCVMVLKKNRGANANNILFADASGLFEEGKTQNILPPEAIDKIVAAYSSRQDIQYLNNCQKNLDFQVLNSCRRI